MVAPSVETALFSIRGNGTSHESKTSRIETGLTKDTRRRENSSAESTASDGITSRNIMSRRKVALFTPIEK
jgi:hypothetical protein